MKLFFTAHEDGEEASLYPAAEGLRKCLGKSFEWDRHINEQNFQAVYEAIAEYKTRKTRKFHR